MRRYRRPILVVLLAIACLVAFVAYDRSVERRADAVEWTVARMPLGISGAEAERRIGRPPDRVTQEMGVFAYSAMLLTASNSLAAEYGKPQMYDVRIWYVGPVTVSVYTDQNDRVALRTAQRPPRRPSIADRLRRFLQNLL
jgi:hypothetical protein